MSQTLNFIFRYTATTNIYVCYSYFMHRLVHARLGEQFSALMNKLDGGLLL